MKDIRENVAYGGFYVISVIRSAGKTPEAYSVPYDPFTDSAIAL